MINNHIDFPVNDFPAELTTGLFGGKVTFSHGSPLGTHVESSPFMDLLLPFLINRL